MSELPMPLVSIIMNCFNGEKYIRDAIESVVNQDYENWELIVWDNRSTDKTSKIISEFTEKNKKIKYFLADKFTALGEARNLAIKQSSGDYIAFLDCDDLWFPSKLSKQIPLFFKNRSIGIVYSDSIFFDDLGDKDRLFRNNRPSRGYCFGELLNSYPISLETAIISRAAIEGVEPLFNEEFNMVEEYDLFVRVGLDWMIDYSDEVLAKWRIHGESWTSTKKERFFIEKEKMYEILNSYLVKRNMNNYLHFLKIARINLTYSKIKYAIETRTKFQVIQEVYRAELDIIKKVGLIIAQIIPASALLRLNLIRKKIKNFRTC